MTINRVRLEPRAWEEAGEQVRDWIPVPVSSAEHGDVTVESWYAPSGLRFTFTRADGLRLLVTEVGLADGLRAIAPELRRLTDGLTGAQFARWVSDRARMLGHAIFDWFDRDNPFRAERIPADGAA